MLNFNRKQRLLTFAMPDWRNKFNHQIEHFNLLFIFFFLFCWPLEKSFTLFAILVFVHTESYLPEMSLNFRLQQNCKLINGFTIFIWSLCFSSNSNQICTGTKGSIRYLSMFQFVCRKKLVNMCVFQVK